MSSQNLKHEVGDFVKIIDDTTCHGFEIGSIIKIEGILDWLNGFYSYEARDEYNAKMLFDDDDCEGI